VTPPPITVPTPPYQVSDVAIDENAIYATVANELETGQTDKGLWTRLYVENDGDEKKTKLAYIKQRAEKMITDERSRAEEDMRATQFLIADAKRLASSSGVSIEEAIEMLKLDVTKVGERYAFKEYRYDRLADALSYARKQVGPQNS